VTDSPGRSDGSRPRISHVLAVLRGEHDDVAVIESAGALARRHGARLTALQLWGVPFWRYFAAMAGLDPADLLREAQEEAMAGLRRIIARTPDDVPVTLVCRRGRPGRVVADEALSGAYDCAVVRGRTVSRRRTAQLGRRHPNFRLVLPTQHT